MARYYIEAYKSDGSSIISCCEGQGVIDTTGNKSYKDTVAYRRLKNTPSLNSRVAYYLVVDIEGNKVEKVYNRLHPEYSFIKHGRKSSTKLPSTHETATSVAVATENSSPKLSKLSTTVTNETLYKGRNY